MNEKEIEQRLKSLDQLIQTYEELITSKYNDIKFYEQLIEDCKERRNKLTKEKS